MSHIYQYQPLPQLQPPYIRLLMIESARFGAPLQVKFVVKRLREGMPKFSAISYTWDGQQLDRPIQIERKTVWITRNLERALVIINQRYPGQLLWADGICINQRDRAEKASQVVAMNLVYGYAQRTLVWLGDPDEARQPWTCRLFSLLHGRLGHTIMEKSWREHFLPALWREIRWFSRMWVVQEVGCNRHDNVKLLFGPAWELDWEYIIQSIPPISRFDWRDGGRGWTDANKIEGLLHIRDEHAERGSILFMMERFASFECNEARDRIAAMAGMQNPPLNAAPTALAIDYVSTDQQIFLRFAGHLVERGFGLALIWLAANKGPQESPWPSWVPDWSKNSGQKPCLDIDDFYGYHATSAGSLMRIQCSKLETYSNGYRATFKKPRTQNRAVALMLEKDRSGYYRLARSQQTSGRVSVTNFNIDLAIL